MRCRQSRCHVRRGRVPLHVNTLVSVLCLLKRCVEQSVELQRILRIICRIASDLDGGCVQTPIESVAQLGLRLEYRLYAPLRT